MLKKGGILFLAIMAIFFMAQPVKGFRTDTGKGGHNTLTTEGLSLKKEVHRNDADGGREFNIWAGDDTVLKGLRDGAHDEDSTKTLGGYLGSEKPIGSNGDGNFYQHYYDPDTGKGWWSNDSALQRALNYEATVRRKIACTPGGLGNLSAEERNRLYDWVGRTMHLLQDMAHPSHTNQESHLNPYFENYVRDHWGEIVNSDGYKARVNVGEYGRAKCNMSPQPGIWSYMHELAKKSKGYATEKYLGFLLGADQGLYEAELLRNVNDLIPEAVKYTACYIDAMYDYIKNPPQNDPYCDSPPEPVNPAGDHPDDRFDVSDGFYWEREFRFTDWDLTNLFMRTAIKKGKVGVWYKRQLVEAFLDGRARYRDASEEERRAIEGNVRALESKMEQRKDLLESDWKGAPDIALFTNGFYNPSISLMLKIAEPVSFQDLDFHPEILKDHPVLLVPTGGFYGLSKSESVKVLLDEYVKSGGILVTFTQQHGSDWGLLPVQEDPQTGLKKPVTGYGYQEDQSCQFNSVYIDTYHPMLSGFSTSTANIGVDGYFTSFPENATVLLRRTANGQPAMILYPYGKGYVVATTLYTDFAFTHNQTNQTEIGFIQNMISWAKKPDTLVEAKPGETVSVSVEVKNYTDVAAASVKFTVLDPSRKITAEQSQSISIPPGQSVNIPFSWTLASTSSLGIYHIDYTLLDGQGNIIQPQAETDSGRFVVSNPPKKYTSDKPIWFSVSTSSQEVIFGAPFDYTFHVFNNTNETRDLTVRAQFRHTSRNREWKITANPNQEATVSETDFFLDSRWFFETMASVLYDESMKQIGSYELSFKGILPSGSVAAQTEKAFYRPGEAVVINSSLKNNNPVNWQSNVRVTVFDSKNAAVFEDSKVVVLLPYGTSSIATNFNLPPNLNPGSYTVRVEVWDGSRLVHTTATTFQITQSQIVVTPSVPVHLSLGANIIPFAVTNTGKLDVISGFLNVSLKDPDGDIVYARNQPFSLGIGQSVSLNVSVTIPSTKFGTYTLSYTQSDETREGKPATIFFSNNATMALNFDKPSYRVRETANLTVGLQNTGKFNLENVPLTISMPDAAYTNTQAISLSPNQNLQLAFPILIPDTITGGQHSVAITLALPSGVEFSKSMTLTVPELELVIGYSGSSTVNAGGLVNLTIENKGGVDSTYSSEKLSMIDSKGIAIYQGTVNGTILVGEKRTLVDIQIPLQTVNGPAFLSIQLKDGRTGRNAYYYGVFNFVGVTTTLQTRTERETYLKTEAITGTSSISNGPVGMEGANLKIAVKKLDSTGAGKFSHFLPKKNWTRLDRPSGITVGLDGSVYVANWGIYPIRRFDRDENLIAKWGSIGSGDGELDQPEGIALSPDGCIYVIDGGNNRILKFDGNGNFMTKWGSKGRDNGQFDSPIGIAAGTDGIVYVADKRNYRIQKFDRDGNFITKWGDWGYGDGQFYYPEGIAVGPDDSVYVADSRNYRIQKFDRNGNFIAKWGTYGQGDGQFEHPIDIAIAPDGSVYVMDDNIGRIQKFDSSGNFIGKWGSKGDGNGQFRYPSSIAIAPDGSVYVAEFMRDCIQKFDSRGTFISKWATHGDGDGQFRYPEGIAIGLDGSVYVLDALVNRIQKFDSDGKLTGQWGSRGNGNGQFDFPEGITIGSDGSVYVADTGNNRIQKFDRDGNFITKWGSTGSSKGEFDGPIRIATGSDGSVYVADVGNNRIQKFGQDGNFIDKWGSVGSGDGELNWPYGIAVGADGSVYVTEIENARVQKFDSNGNFIMKFGREGSGDGEFDWPANIALGPDGSIFVADSGNNRIQKFDSNGNFITKWESSEDGEFGFPEGIAIGSDGSVYVTDGDNPSVQRINFEAIVETLFESTLPIDQPASATKDYVTNIGALDATGKLFLQATLTNSLGQTIAEASYPFYVYEGNTVLSFHTDKKVYRPGEAVTITGQVENRASMGALGLSISLTAKQGIQITPLLNTEALNIPAGGTYSFSVTSTAGTEGPVTLTGKAIQNNSTLAEITDLYEVAKPAISASVNVPDAVGNEAFNINVQLKNEGKAGATVNFGVRGSEFGDSQIIIVPAGETKLLLYSQQITKEVTYTFTFSGDLEQTITKKVSYGLSASVGLNSQAIYAEGSVAVPVTVTNTGPLAGTIEVIFEIFSPPPSPSPIQGEGNGAASPLKEDKKSYYLPAGGSIADTLYFTLTEGDYWIVATSQVPMVNGPQANFSVRKENRVDLMILAGTQESGLIPVTVNLSNLGNNDLSGSISARVSDQNKVIWNSAQSLDQLAKQNSRLVTFHIDPSAIPPGDYTLTTEFLNNGGQQLGWRSAPLSIKGPVFQITQLPSYQTFNPGQEATFTFRVKNTGNQEGSLEFHFKSYDRIDITRQEWFKAGEEKALDFAFPLPEDLEEKDYFASYRLGSVVSGQLSVAQEGQVKYHLAGINLTVKATLDKPHYSEGEAAHLTLSVSTPSSSPQSLFARVNYAGYESKQPFQLNGTQTLSFDIPLAKITGEKLFFGIYQESGRSIHLNSLYIYKAGDVFTLKTDKQVYRPGETVSITVSGQQAVTGTLTLTAPSYEETFAFSGNVQKSFVLPSLMTAGTYYISYQLLGISGQQYKGTQPFDVEGIQVKVKTAKLDKVKYASSDTMNLNLTIESNQNLAATLKAWVVDPEKNYSPPRTKEIALTGTQPFLATQSSSFSTTKLGIHRMVYGIYKEEMLLASGSYAFDVGEAILLGISTDRADYPQGNEPIVVDAKVYGTVPGNLEFSVDGQSVGNQSVSLSGFSSIQYTLPAVSPGLHTLKVSLTSGGLASTKQTTVVYGSNLPDLSVRMTSDPNMKDGFMTITITVTNHGKSASCPTTLSLYDGAQLLTTLEVKGLQPGESQTFTYRLNVIGRAGTNSLLGRIDPGNQVYEFNKGNNEANLNFAVPDLTLGTSLDKIVYAPGETIGITSSITNLSKDLLSDLTLTTEAKDVTGLQVFTRTQNLSTLEGKATASIQTPWLTDASLKEGVYSIIQTIQGKVTARAAASLEVKDFAKGIEGTITAQPNLVDQGRAETLSYTLTNKGSVDLNDLRVKVLVINPENGEVKNTYEKAVDLPQNATLSGSFSASTAGLPPRVYSATLQASSAVILTPKTLGSASFEVKAAVPMISWAKTYEGSGYGVAYSIHQAQDGGYIVAGATGSISPLHRDAWVWKLGVKGEIQWQKTYGSRRGDAAYAVQPTTDGGYIAAGETHGILGMGRQSWVWKLDVHGEIRWQKTYGDGWARSIQQTLGGGYIVAGAGKDHAWVMKLDQNGEMEWRKAYGRHGDAAYSIQQTAEEGYIVAGVAHLPGNGPDEAWVMKLDAQGKIQWQKTYGGHHGDAAYSIQQTGEGGYIVAGVTNSFGHGDSDAWVLKLDPDGGIQWQKAYGGQQGDAAYSIQQTIDNGYIVAGVTNSFGHGDSDAWVLKLSAQGGVQWQKAYGGRHGDAALAVDQGKDGGYIMAGGTNSFGDRDYDVWVWKLDEKGEIPGCQAAWMEETKVTPQGTGAVVRDSSMVGKDTYVPVQKSHAWVRETQGMASDACVGVPEISVDPSFVNFLGVKVGKSSTKTMMVSNRGTGELKINSIRIVKADPFRAFDATQFSQRNNCGVVRPGESCTIWVSFQPTARGPRNAGIVILANDPNQNSLWLKLFGEGK